MSKARFVVKFAAACVGSGVATGMKVYNLGAAGGREIVGMSRLGLSSFAGKVAKAVPRSTGGETRERDEITFRSSETPIRPIPQPAERTRKPRSPRAKAEKQPSAPEPPRRKDKLPVRKSTALNPKLDRLETALSKVAENVQQRVAEALTPEDDKKDAAVCCAQGEDYDERDRLLAKQGRALAKIVEELKDMRDLVQQYSHDVNSSKE